MTKHSLSLCMIVKDEEETVGRAIKSALAVVDEVVVVDTGSTDNTRLIVEGYGARVVDFPWCDDFSAARNAGIAAAYGDWILVLDADEVLESIRPVEMGRLLANEAAIAYFARVRSEVPGKAPVIADKVRLFRNHPEARFRYPIHEQVTPALSEIADRDGGDFLSSALSIVHFGVADGDDQGKRSRNQRLLGLAIDAYPEEPYFRYQLACEMAVYLDESALPVKGFGQMLRELERAVELVSTLPIEQVVHVSYGADLYSRYAAALLAVDRVDDAITALEDGLGMFGEGSLLIFHHGCALLHRGMRDGQSEDVDAAEQRMLTMLEGDHGVEPAPISPAYFSLYPHRYLGLVRLAKGDAKGARKHFETALKADPAYTGALCGLARAADADGRPRQALQIYLRALSLNESEVNAWVEGSELLIRLGFGDNALSWLQKLSAFLPEHPRVQRLLEHIHKERFEHAGHV